MFSYIRGRVVHKTAHIKKDNYVVIETTGLGYKIYVLDRTLNTLTLGTDYELFLHTQVAETVLDLFGFAERVELEFFELLIGISGIGPRSALDILQKAKIDDLREAVQSDNASLLAKVSGIGPKTAEKIVIGLKDKLGASPVLTAWNEQTSDALEALVGLGYSAVQARDALKQSTASDVSEQVREALKYLAK